MEGNMASFPVVRVSEPLVKLPHGHKLWQDLGFNEKGKRRRPPPDAQRIKSMEEALGVFGFGPLSKKTNDLWARLRDFKAQELLSTAKRGGTLLEVVEAVAESFRARAKSPVDHLKAIAVNAVDGLSREHLTAVDAVEQFLLGKGPPKENGKSPDSTIQLAFDVENVDEFHAHLYSEKVKKKLIAHLPQDPCAGERRSKRKKPGLSGLDAFTGESGELEEKTFPKVELPVPSSRSSKQGGGKRNFPLSSMFSAAKCNKRYGMTDARVFPLARTRATTLKEALEYITADDREGRTWQHVASGRFETRQGRKVPKTDLLIVYVEERPALDAKTAGYFGQGLAVTEAKFEVDATAVCQALRGVEREHPQSRLSLTLIRAASKGQAQVVLYTTPSVKEMLSAAERWQSAVKENLPRVTLRLPPPEKGSRTIEGRPLAPYPDQVVRLLSYQWVRDGSSAKSPGGKRQEARQALVGPSLGDVLTLMLRNEGKWEQTASQMLALLLQRVTPLLVGVFGAAHAFGPRQGDQRHEPLFDYPGESRRTALRAVSVLGILLDALACRKEVYMESAPYQVGQVLALADTLHKDYCIVVRKGSLPNSLIGTALMRRALDSPAGALADLAERMIEYVRWAKTAEISSKWEENDRKKIAVWEARKKLRQYQVLAARLGTAELPTDCSDVMKAQLLLGFLASPPFDAEDEDNHDGKEGRK